MVERHSYKVDVPGSSPGMRTRTQFKTITIIWARSPDVRPKGKIGIPIADFVGASGLSWLPARLTRSKKYFICLDCRRIPCPQGRNIL